MKLSQAHDDAFEIFPTPIDENAVSRNRVKAKNAMERRAEEQLAAVQKAIELAKGVDWESYRAAGGAESLEGKDLDAAWAKIAKVPIEYRYGRITP